MTFFSPPFRRLSLAAVGTLFLLISACVGMPTEERSELTIYYSGSLNGNLAGCDCWGYPVAGLAKRAYYLRRIPDRDRSLLLDTGNLLEPGEDRLQADLLFTSYAELGYDLIGIGPNDFSNGVEALSEYRENHPMQSHNLLLRGYAPPSPPNNFSIDGVEVEILSLADPDLFAGYPDEFHDQVEILDPTLVLTQSWGELPDTALRILLLNGSHSTAIKLGFTGLTHLILYSPGEKPAFEELENGTILASAGLDGNSLGILTLGLDSRGVKLLQNWVEEFDYLKSPADPHIQNRADEYVRILRKRISGSLN